jgi:hypothetical protein
VKIQQPNVSTFAKADYKLLQQMSDNDDDIRNNLEMNAKGVVCLAISNNMNVALPNYSSAFGVYTQSSSVGWTDVQFTQPDASKLSVNFEANRYYKFMIHFDYVWAANVRVGAADVTGKTGRIEVRVRDITHRRDVIYWTNLVDPDYNMGGYVAGPYILHRDTEAGNLPDVNIYSWDEASADGCVPSSCHAVRVMAAKTSGTSILRVQFRPMVGFGGVQPPLSMDVTNTTRPVIGLPQQYVADAGRGGTRDTEAMKQFNGYFSVEDCGPVEKPAGVAAGAINDNSISPFFEMYENHAYDSTVSDRP